jgi:hypothetical protein
VDSHMWADKDIDHLLDRLAERQRSKDSAIGMSPQDRNWLAKAATNRLIGLAVICGVGLVGYIWTSNNRMTAAEINAQYTRDGMIEVKHDVAETRKEVIDVKREVGDVKRDIQNLSSRLATTRRGFMTPAAPEPKDDGKRKDD